MMMPGLRRHLAALAATLLAATTFAAPPAGYYDDATGLSGMQLKAALHDIITRGQNNVGYSNTWTNISTVWEEPGQPTLIRIMYTGGTRLKTAQCSTSCNDSSATTGTWSREHIFPQSEFGSNEPALSDLHALFPVDADVNSSRSNKKFDTVTGTVPALLVGTGANTDVTAFEPRDSDKGDVARALLYMALRYEGETGVIDLEPIDQAANSNSSDGRVGNLTTLLAWNTLDPPDTFEQDRNDRVFAIQGNRNPFIDNPAYASQVPWGSTSETGIMWVNEIHYDNSGADVNEGVEIAAPVAKSTALWRIYGYNGGDGTTYGNVILQGVVKNQQNGYGTLWFPFSGLQNGAPDGVALVSPTGTVVQFLSYEGTFTATNGPANGMLSTAIPTSEGGAATDSSLQLQGTGTAYAQFTWSGEITATRGLVNTGQTFPPPSTVVDWAVY